MREKIFKNLTEKKVEELSATERFAITLMTVAFEEYKSGYEEGYEDAINGKEKMEF